MKKNKVVVGASFRLTPEILAMAKQLSEKHGVGLSALLRMLILKEYVK
jgi:hypothetical protein